MLTNVRSMISKLVLGLLAITVSFPLISGIHGSEGIRAENDRTTKTSSNTRLGVDQISNPKIPSSADDVWNGSYVYYGTYKTGRNIDCIPMKFRVLNKEGTSPYGGLFLDSDAALFVKDFYKDNGESAWYYCALNKLLNGDKYYGSDEIFTERERKTILTQNVPGHDLAHIDEFAMGWFKKFISLTNQEKIFVLDAEDILNSSYGYWPYVGFDGAEHETVKNRMKVTIGSTAYNTYWLRSAFGPFKNQLAGIVSKHGYLDGENIDNKEGVAPAFSVKLSSILFSTAIKGNYGSLGTEYKLTLIEPSFSVSLTSGKKTSISGRTVSIPYTASFETNESDQLSVMILDKPYAENNANKSNILYYGTLSSSISKTGTATFDVPSNFNLSKWGRNYYVYFFAERYGTSKYDYVNVDQLSDYAGTPILLERPSDYVTTIILPSDYSYVDLNQRQCDALVCLMTSNMVGCYINDKSILIDVDKDGVYDFSVVNTSSVPAPAVRIINSPICGTYSFDVSNCAGSYLHEVKIILNKPKPPAPTGLKGSADTSTSVKHTWEKASYADEYEVYRSTSIDGTYSKLGTVTETNRRCPGLTSGTKYYFKVRSVMYINSVKYYGDFTSPISVVPPFPAPSGVKATSSSNTAVTVSWNAVKGATGYVVYRSTSENGTYTRLGTVTGTSRKCTGLTSGKKYYFKVRAIVTYDGTTYYGKYSSPVSAIPPLPKPDYINVIPGATSTSALVYWNEVKGATGYVVYRSTSENGDYTRLGTVKTTDRTCTGLKKGQTYYFKVRAINVVDGKTCYGSYTAPKKYTVK